MMSADAMDADILVSMLGEVADELEGSEFDLDRVMTRKDLNQAVAAILLSLRVKLREEQADLMEFEAKDLERKANDIRGF